MPQDGYLKCVAGFSRREEITLDCEDLRGFMEGGAFEWGLKGYDCQGSQSQT